MKKETKKAVKSCLRNSTSLTETAVLEMARSRIGEFLPLEAAGYACTTEQLLDVLVAVSVGKKSYRTKHVFKSAKHRQEEVEMAMFKGFTTGAKKGRKVRKAKWLAYMLIECEANLSAKKVKQKYRKRFGIEASYRSRQESARVDNQHQCGVSVSVNRNEFSVDKYLARIAKRMDKKSPSWESELEVGEISLKKIRQFSEKSDRKSIWNGQRNRNEELKSTEIAQIWIY